MNDFLNQSIWSNLKLKNGRKTMMDSMAGLIFLYMWYCCHFCSFNFQFERANGFNGWIMDSIDFQLWTGCALSHACQAAPIPLGATAAQTPPAYAGRCSAQRSCRIMSHHYHVVSCRIMSYQTIMSYHVVKCQELFCKQFTVCSCMFQVLVGWWVEVEGKRRDAKLLEKNKWPATRSTVFFFNFLR